MKIEIYQLDFEVCFDCCMNQTTSKINKLTHLQIRNSN